MSRERQTEQRSAKTVPARREASRKAPGTISQLQEAADRASAASPLQDLQRMAMQRMEKDDLQMKPVQRMEEDELQMKPVQRMEEEELQMKPMQRMEEEELQMKPVQRMEEDELQMKGQPASRSNGLPAPLKQGIEALSGHAMDDVAVHRNSSRPAEVGAHAYAQGRDIHLGPGQEQHLPHEAWHVVQQAEGRVRPTTEVAGVAVNDDAGLEAEADQMGAKAQQHRAAPDQPLQRKGHSAGCGCSSCRSLQRHVSIHTAPKMQSVPGSIPIQRTNATLNVNDSQRGNGHAPIGTPIERHAERQSWEAAENHIDAAFRSDVETVKITFGITQKVCSSCQDWFDTVVYPTLAAKSVANENKAFELRVEVDGEHVIVKGAGYTPWRDTMADETRLTIAEQMAEYLVTWGGTGEEDGANSKIFIPDDRGILVEHIAYNNNAESLETLMINLQVEIRAAHARRQAWMDTGYHLEGAQKDLNMDEVAAENANIFGRDRRIAQKDQ